MALNGNIISAIGKDKKQFQTFQYYNRGHNILRLFDI